MITLLIGSTEKQAQNFPVAFYISTDFLKFFITYLLEPISRNHFAISFVKTSPKTLFLPMPYRYPS